MHRPRCANITPLGIRPLARPVSIGRQIAAFAALPAIVAVLGLLALAAPLRDAEQPLLRVGALLALAGILEMLMPCAAQNPPISDAGSRAVRSRS